MRIVSGLERATALARPDGGARALRLAGLTAAGAGGLLGGHIAFRLAGGANQAEPVPHPLSEGSLDNGCLTCPWHDSTFRIADGSVIHGPATAPQPTFQTRIEGDVIQVCLPGAG
jgi:Rieske [2Fe-2S] domain